MSRRKIKNEYKIKDIEEALRLDFRAQDLAVEYSYFKRQIFYSLCIVFLQFLTPYFYEKLTLIINNQNIQFITIFIYLVFFGYHLFNNLNKMNKFWIKFGFVYRISSGFEKEGVKEQFILSVDGMLKGKEFKTDQELTLYKINQKEKSNILNHLDSKNNGIYNRLFSFDYIMKFYSSALALNNKPNQYFSIKDF